MRRFPLLVLTLAVVALSFPAASRETSRDLALCEGERQATGEVFSLVCSGRVGEARRVVDSQPNSTHFVDALVAYAAANMERGDFAEGIAATREMLEIRRLAGLQHGSWSRRQPSNPQPKRRVSGGQVLPSSLVRTWPWAVPPGATSPPPPPLMTGVLTIHESLLAHPYPVVERILPSWLDLVSAKGIDWEAREALLRTARWLIHKGADAQAARLLRRGLRSAQSGQSSFETLLVRDFVEINEPERALAALSREGGHLAAVDSHQRWRLIVQLIGYDRIEVAEKVVRSIGQRSAFAWYLAEGYAKRGDRPAALEALGLAAETERQAERNVFTYLSHLRYAEAFHYLGDEQAMRAELSRAESAVTFPQGWHRLELKERVDLAVVFSLVTFARVKLLRESVENGLQAMPEPFSRVHFLALAINDFAEQGDVERVRRLIDLLVRVWVPVVEAERITRKYIGDEARFQAALRLSARGDSDSGLRLAQEISDKRDQAYAIEQVAKVAAIDRATDDIGFFVEYSRLPAPRD